MYQHGVTRIDGVTRLGSLPQDWESETRSIAHRRGLHFVIRCVQKGGWGVGGSGGICVVYRKQAAYQLYHETAIMLYSKGSLLQMNQKKDESIRNGTRNCHDANVHTLCFENNRLGRV